jgi:hypothetical protein
MQQLDIKTLCVLTIQSSLHKLTSELVSNQETENCKSSYYRTINHKNTVFVCIHRHWKFENVLSYNYSKSLCVIKTHLDRNLAKWCYLLHYEHQYVMRRHKEPSGYTKLDCMCHCCSCSLSPTSSVLPKNLRSSQPVKKFPILFESRTVITVFTRSCHWLLCWVRWIQPVPSHPTFLKTHLNTVLPYRLSKWCVPFMRCGQNFVGTHLSSLTCIHVPLIPSSLIWLSQQYLVKSSNH